MSDGNRSSDSGRSLGLPALLGRTAADKLLRGWPAKPFAAHGLRRSFAPLASLPFLESLDALLNAWPFAVQAHLPEASDEAISVDATPKDAKKLFESGMPLLFDQVQRISNVLRDWLGAIASDLGLPKMTLARCMVYATPDGKGTAAHFDQNVNLVLQLTGTKKWWLAANQSVAHPSQRHTLGLPIDPELASQLSAPLPLRAPGKKTSFTLEPGSLLFVPQGFWHGTEASGEALSLNFTYSQPSFADLFLAALKSRLLLSPDWRALADGVSSRELSRRNQAAARLQLLLAELVHDLPNWNAADILGATEGDEFGDPRALARPAGRS